MSDDPKDAFRRAAGLPTIAEKAEADALRIAAATRQAELEPRRQKLRAEFNGHLMPLISSAMELANEVAAEATRPAGISVEPSFGLPPGALAQFSLVLRGGGGLRANADITLDENGLVSAGLGEHGAIIDKQSIPTITQANVNAVFASLLAKLKR